MTGKWNLISVRKVFKRIKSNIKVEKNKIYKRITIRMNGGGVLLRDKTLGANIGTENQFLVRQNQFIVSKIDARNGAFGIVGTDCDEAIITGNFWVFDVDFSQVNPIFFRWLTQTQLFIDFCIHASSGTTNRLYLQEDKFLEQLIPLPPLEEQQRIVTYLNGMEKQLMEAKTLQEANARDLKNLLRSHHQRITKDAPLKRLGEVAPLERRPVKIDPTRTYREVGARSFGKGLFFKPDFVGAETTWEKPVRIHKNDLVFSNIKAWEGAIAVAEAEHDNVIASHRYVTCLPDLNVVNPQYLKWHFLSPVGLEEVSKASRGSADRNRTLSLKALENILVPVPPLWQQQQFTALCAQQRMLEEQHNIMDTALNETLPALLERVFAT